MKKVFFLFTFTLLATVLFGADRFWVGAGNTNSNNTANWSTTSGGAGGASVPGGNDTAIFDANGIVNCHINAGLSVKKIKMLSGYTDTIFQDAGINFTIGSGGGTFSGGVFKGGTTNITLSGATTISGTNFISTSGGLTISANFTLSSGTFFDNGGSVYTATNNITITGAFTFNNLEFYSPQNYFFNIASTSTVTVNGLLKFNGNANTYLTVNTGTIHAKGNISNIHPYVLRGSTSLVINGTGNQTYTGTGYGGIDVTINKSSGILYVTGNLYAQDFTYTAGTIDDDTYDGTFRFLGGTLTGSVTLNKIYFNNGNADYTIATGTTLTVDSLLYMGGGATRVRYFGGNINVKGNIYCANTGDASNGFGGGSTVITINGTSDQTFTSLSSTWLGFLPALTINKSSGTLYLSGYFNMVNSFIYTAGTVNVGTSTFAFYGQYPTTLTGNFTFNNLTFIAATTFSVTSSSTITVNGDLTVGSSGPSLNGGTINAKGDITFTSTTGSGGGTATLNINGTSDQNLTGSTVLGKGALPSVNINKSSGTLYFKNIITTKGPVWTYTAGTVDASTYTSTVAFDMVNSATTINGSQSFYNLTINNSSTIDRTLTLASGVTLSVNGALTVSGSKATVISGISSNIDAYRDITITNTNTTGGTGTTLFNIKGSNNQTLTGSGVAGAGLLPTTTINKSGGTLSLSSIITCNKDWTYTAGTVDPGTSTVVFSSTGNVDPQGTSTTMSFNKVYFYSGTRTLTGNLIANSDLKIYSGATLTQNSKTMKIGGSWDNSGTYTTSSAMVTFNGSSNTTLTKSSGSETFNRVCLSKSSTGNFTLNNPVIIADSLKFVKGQLISTSTNYVKINDNAKASGGSDSAFVSGYLKKIGNDAFTFPMGKGTNNYHPITITAPSSTSDDFSAQYDNSGQTLGSTTDGTINNLSTCENWTLDRNVGSSNVSVTLNWNANSCLLGSLNNMVVASWNGSQWNNLHNGGTTGNTTAGSVTTSAAATSFGRFTLAQCGVGSVSSSDANDTICKGSSVTLTASGGSTYSWNTGSTSAAITVSPTVTTSYSVTVANSYGCTKLISKTIAVPTPTVAISGTSTTICYGSSATLTATASSGCTYSWNTGATTSVLPVIEPASTGTYVVTATNSSGCTASASFVLTINDSCAVEYEDSIPMDSVTGAPQLRIALPIGTSPGSFSVSQGGGASYTMPLTVPPGTNGMVPNLSVSYNSNAGDGMMGMGWMLSGLSEISRAQRTIYYNGKVAPVMLNDSDNFVMDGAMLIPTSGSNGDDGTEYGTESESFSRVISHGTAGDGPSYFTVETKDGSVLEYGVTSNSRIEATGSSTALRWLLSKVTDNNGNYMLIHYSENSTTGEALPITIDYSGNSAASLSPYNKIKFIYRGRDDKRVAYVAGSKVSTTLLLSGIEMYAQNVKVHQYNFEYGYNMGSHLSEVIEKGSNGSQLNSTKFFWDDGQSMSPGQHLIPGFHGNRSDYAPDVNGDGFPDMVEIISSGGWQLRRNDFPTTGNIQFSSSLISSGSLPANSASVKYYRSNYHAGNGADLNGDGYDDLLIFTPFFSGNSASFRYYLSNHTGLVPGVGSPFIPQSTVSGGNNISQCDYTMGDYDGDGTTDLFIYYSSNKAWYVYSFRSDTVEQIATGFDGDWENLSLTDPSIQFFSVDMNGDGKEEIGVFTDGSQTGNTFVVNELTTSGTLNEIYADDYPSNYLTDNIMPADFNADGKTDVLIWSHDDSAWKIRLSDGVGYLASSSAISALDNYDGSHSTVTDSLINIHQVFAVDINADGKTDIIEKTTTGADDNGTDIHTLYGNGDGTTFTENTTHFNETYSQEDAFSTATIGFADFNADGHADMFYRDGNNEQDGSIFSYFENKNIHKVKDIYNGYNAHIQIEYNTLPLLSMSGKYSKDSTAEFPLNDFQRPMLTVSSVLRDNGIGGMNETGYEYGGAKIHKQGKGFLGFRLVASTDSVTGLKMENTYTEPGIANFFVRTPSKSISSSLTQGSLSEATYSAAFVTGSSLELGDPSSRRYYAFTDTIIRKDQLHGNITNTVVVTKDKWGNILSQTTSNDVMSSTTTNSYEQVHAWIPSRIVSTSSTTVRDTTTYIRRTSVENDSLGRPETITSDGGNAGIINITYNVFGNVVAAAKSGSGIATRTDSSFYDSKGRFVTSQKNALGHTGSSTYNNAYGNVLTQTDANGLTTSFEYDGFGRVDKTITPTGSEINITRGYDFSSVDNGISYVQTTQTGMPATKQFSDILGRTLRTQTQGFDGTLVKVDQTYNSSGQVDKKYEPFTDTPDRYTEYTYDSLFRVLSIASPSGALVEYNYVADTTVTEMTVTQGSVVKSSSKTFDQSGALTHATDDGGEILYAYHANGKPLQIISPGGATINMRYDSLGRKIRLDDPDAGQMNFQYNVLGELTRQTDSKGNIFDMTYDLLGRMTLQKGNHSDSVIYQYDDTHGKGMIDRVTGSAALYNGIICNYDYDSFSRLAGKTETIDATNYGSSYDYDDLGRVVQETYPSGFATTMEYNSRGYLEKINNAANNHLLWQCNSLNIRGQLTEATAGNGLVMSQAYSALGLLQNTQVNKNSTPVWDMSYNFDSLTGNLTSRTNNLNSLNEAFLYDYLDRLNQVELNSTVTLAIGYGTGTGISTKTDVGTYEYSASQPHAVSAIAGPTANVPVVKQKITYTPFLKADTIMEGNRRGKIYYGPDQQRRKMEIKDSTGNLLETRYYLGDYEKVIKDTMTYEVHYINASNGLVAINTITNGGSDEINYVYTDHLGSINALFGSDTTKTFEQSFDAWGRERDPADWDGANPNAAPEWLVRGYTGHEHLKDFALINMNGRMYDPLLGKMLSPDNNIQAPDVTENYNRYSYVLNNPLKYTDPTGEEYGGDINDYGVAAYWNNDNYKFMESSQFKNMDVFQKSAWLGSHAVGGGKAYAGWNGDASGDATCGQDVVDMNTNLVLIGMANATQGLENISKNGEQTGYWGDTYDVTETIYADQHNLPQSEVVDPGKVLYKDQDFITGSQTNYSAIYNHLEAEGGHNIYENLAEAGHLAAELFVVNFNTVKHLVPKADEAAREVFHRINKGPAIVSAILGGGPALYHILTTDLNHQNPDDWAKLSFAVLGLYLEGTGIGEFIDATSLTYSIVQIAHEKKKP